MDRFCTACKEANSKLMRRCNLGEKRRGEKPYSFWFPIRQLLWFVPSSERAENVFKLCKCQWDFEVFFLSRVTKHLHCAKKKKRKNETEKHWFEDSGNGRLFCVTVRPSVRIKAVWLSDVDITQLSLSWIPLGFTAFNNTGCVIQCGQAVNINRPLCITNTFHCAHPSRMKRCMPKMRLMAPSLVYCTEGHKLYVDSHRLNESKAPRYKDLYKHGFNVQTRFSFPSWALGSWVVAHA